MFYGPTCANFLVFFATPMAVWSFVYRFSQRFSDKKYGVVAKKTIAEQMMSCTSAYLLYLAARARLDQFQFPHETTVAARVRLKPWHHP